MNLQAMTKEKLQFLLPVVFTVGPDVNARGANAKAGAEPGRVHTQEDRGDSLMKYAMLLTDTNAKGNNTTTFLENIVKGIIEGEVRVLVSSMTMEEIFTEREEFSESNPQRHGLIFHFSNKTQSAASSATSRASWTSSA